MHQNVTEGMPTKAVQTSAEADRALYSLFVMIIIVDNM